MAGAKLAQLGLSALILEKDHFPRFHIGESMLPVGNRVLEEIGVLPAIERAGFIRKYGARFSDPQYKFVKRISFADALGNHVPSYTYQVERAVYDSILLDHARSLGCEVRHGAHVKSVEEDADGISIKCKDSDEVIRARWLLDATGRDSVTARLAGIKRKDVPNFNKRIAIYTHLEGVKIAPGVEGGDTVAVRFEDGWVWVIPLDSQKTSVGLVLDVSSYDKSQRPEDIYWSKLRSSSYLADILENARAVDEKMRVTSDYSYFHEGSVSTARILPIGDAFGFLDPIFSSGVHLSQSSALNAAQLIKACSATGRGFTPAERSRYEKRLLKRATSFRKLIQAFYAPVGFKVFLDPGEFLRIADAITNIVAGDAEYSFGVWWRYHLFLAICRLQPVIPIVSTARKVDLTTPTPAGTAG